MDLRKWEIPRSVNYIGQMVIIFAVTCTSLYKPCTCHDNEQLWIALLCSSLGPYAWSCLNGLRLVLTAKTSLSQFSGIHESEKRSPNALGRPTAKSANYQA